MVAWLVIADDLTGACDTGAPFAARGYGVEVQLAGFLAPDAPPGMPPGEITPLAVRVVNTDSRDLSASEAARRAGFSGSKNRTRQFWMDFLSRGSSGEPPLVYKKIDSTLRGHPAEELTAVMGALETERALVCPAFPAQGRVVLGGRVLVNGTPLEALPFAHLPRLDLAVVRQGVGQVAERLRAEPGPLLCDAETDDDLRVLARAGRLAGLRLFCGSAGLARALAADLPDGPQRAVFTPRPGAPLVVAGSLHPPTLAQVAGLRSAGAREGDAAEVSAEGSADLAAALARGQTGLIAAPLPPGTPALAKTVAEDLARAALAALEIAPVCGLVLTGGDTATAVCRALSCDTLRLGGELEPGIVWGWLARGPYAGLPVVTKAGGFGDPGALLRAVGFLRGG